MSKPVKKKKPETTSVEPAFDFFVYEDHRDLTAQGTKKYQAAVVKAATKIIPKPIDCNGLSVEILYTSRSSAPQAGIDDIIKPTLEALRGIAYNDEGQIDSVTATFFDRNQNTTISKGNEILGPFLFSSHQHVILVRIFSAAHRGTPGEGPSASGSSASWLSDSKRADRAKIRGNDTSKFLRSK